MLFTRGYDRESQERYRVDYDASSLESAEDAGPGSRATFDRGELSGRAMVRANGFDPDVDAPDADERKNRFVREVLLKKKVEDAVASIQVAVAAGAIEEFDLDLDGVDMPTNSPVNDPDGPDSGDEGESEEDANPEVDPEEPETSGETVTQSHVVLAKLRTAADFAFVRAVEIAASKVISSVKSGPDDLQHKLRKVGKPDVLAEAGVAGLRALNLDAGELFEGHFDELSRKGRLWLSEHLRACGVEPVQAENDAELAMAEIVAGLVQLGRDQVSGRVGVDADGFRVPESLIHDALGLTPGGLL